MSIGLIKKLEARCSISLKETFKLPDTFKSADMESLYQRLVVGDDFPTPNDSDPAVGLKSSDCSTEQPYFDGSEFWVLTCVFRPTRKILFIYVSTTTAHVAYLTASFLHVFM